MKEKSMSYLNGLLEAQKKDLHEARGYLERAEAEKRDLSVEERTAWDALNAEIDNRQDHINQVRAAEQRDARVAEAMVSAPETRAEARQVADQPSDADMIRAIARGEMRSATFERRNLEKATSTKGPETVPQSFYDVIQEQLATVSPLLDPSVVTLLTTASGEDIKVPVQSSRMAGTAIAEGDTYAESDPTFTNITLRSHKTGTLTVVSEELLSDTGIDLVGFLGRQMGIALGTAIGQVLTQGTGTVQANGIVTALGTAPAVTGGTGVAGAFTGDNLIALMHAVDSVYAAQPGAGWMMSRATLGAVRALKGAEGYLFQPFADAGSPGSLLGYRVVENPFMPSIGTAATSATITGKSVIFGDLSAFHTRVVGGVEIVRSDEAYWTSDQVAFKARIRVDGDLGGGRTDAVKFFRGGTA
jgi:HK97 family phage major capsid protein